MTIERVRQFLLDLHSCWPAGDAEALAVFYHPDVVLLPPDLGAPIRGRSAVVESYREFLAAATLQAFSVTDLEIFEFAGGSGATSMAHLHFEIRYQLGNEQYLDSGLEIYTVVETEGRLQIVWRGQNVLDSRLASKSEAAGQQP